MKKKKKEAQKSLTGAGQLGGSAVAGRYRSGLPRLRQEKPCYSLKPETAPRACRHERLSCSLCVKLLLLFRSSTIRVHSLHKRFVLLASAVVTKETTDEDSSWLPKRTACNGCRYP